MRQEKYRSSDKYAKIHDELKAIKYPVPAISYAMHMSKRKNMLSTQLKTKLNRAINPTLNAYRRVRGDGNCFFRALAFSYITNCKRWHCSSVFSYLKDLSLETCKQESIPKQFKPYYKDEILKGVLKQYWDCEYDYFLSSTIQNPKRALAKMLTENPYLDFIIILYFRSLCLATFRKQKDQLKDFLKGTEQEEIMTYGEESEGVILDVCARFHSINIYIYEIRKEEIATYHYKHNKGGYKEKELQIFLLFYDGHYDVFEHNRDPTLQFNDDKEEEYYSEVNSKLVEGECIECGKKTEVGEENALCQECMSKSKATLDQFGKDRKVVGECTQCGRKSSISQQLMMCDNCLFQIQYASIPTQPVGKTSGVKHQKPQEVGSTGRVVCKYCYERVPADMVNTNGICYDCHTPPTQVVSFGAKATKINPSVASRQVRCSSCHDPEYVTKFINGLCVRCRNRGVQPKR